MHAPLAATGFTPREVSLILYVKAQELGVQAPKPSPQVTRAANKFFAAFNTALAILLQQLPPTTPTTPRELLDKGAHVQTYLSLSTHNPKYDRWLHDLWPKSDIPKVKRFLERALQHPFDNLENTIFNSLFHDRS